MKVSDIDVLLTELTDYGSRLMLAEGLPAEALVGLRTVKGDKGVLVHVAEAIDNVLDLRLLADSVDEEE